MIFIDQNTKTFIQQHIKDDVKQLALKASSHSSVDILMALRQIAARQTVKIKIPSWYENEDIIYPVHLSMEQCSSEKTAIYKSRLCKGNTLTDLTGGLGVDFAYMSSKVNKSTYVEAQNELTELAQHNFKSLNLSNYTILNNDAVDYLNRIEEIQDIIYIDPARRSKSGSKTVLIEDCTPNLIEIDDLLDSRANKVIIKLSPMLDISRAIKSLNNISEIHIISIANECKELLFIKEKKRGEKIKIHCVNLLNNGQEESFIFTLDQEKEITIKYTDSVLQYLYEPNSSILKGGAYKSIASTFGLKKLHPNSHLYTSDNYIEDFPGRKFLVKKAFSPNKKELKENLKTISQANISIRNYPFSVAELRKQTKLKEGGQDYLFATTLSNEKKVLILCEKADIQ